LLFSPSFSLSLAIFSLFFFLPPSLSPWLFFLSFFFSLLLSLSFFSYLLFPLNSFSCIFLSFTNIFQQFFLKKMSQSQTLTILRQTCIAEERYTSNGIQKNVHVVIKNQPFVVELGLIGNASSSDRVNFNSLTIEANLLYDTPDNSRKEVGFIKVKPLEYQGHVDENDATKCKLEVQIKILSSQHEDSLFKIHFRVLDSASGQRYSHLEAISREILVISKPEVLRKKNEPRKKKRTRDEQVLESLSRIEQRFQALEQRLNEQQKLVEKLSQANSSSSSSSREKKVGAFLEPETAVTSFVNAFSALTPEEKPEKVRKVIRQFSIRETERLYELLDLFWAEGLHKQFLRDNQTSVVNLGFDFQEDPSFDSLYQQYLTLGQEPQFLTQEN
jgi:hypothetical protein